jgi:hypothetical protein
MVNGAKYFLREPRQLNNDWSMIGSDQVEPETGVLDEGGIAKKRRVSATTEPEETGPVSEQQAEVQPDPAACDQGQCLAMWGMKPYLWLKCRDSLCICLPA